MFRIAPLRLLTPFVTRLGPPAFRRALVEMVPIAAVQQLKDMSDQMDRTCREILNQKRHPPYSALVDAMHAVTSNSTLPVSESAVRNDLNSFPPHESEAEHVSVEDGRDIMSILRECAPRCI